MSFGFWVGVIPTQNPKLKTQNSQFQNGCFELRASISGDWYIDKKYQGRGKQISWTPDNKGEKKYEIELRMKNTTEKMQIFIDKE